MSTTRRCRAQMALAVSAVAALALAGCGGSDGGGASEAEKAERAFLTAMVHHHETGVEMSEVGQEQGGSFVRKLSGEIISTQEKEIEQMGSIHARLFDEELKPDPMAHDGLGLSAAEAGMTHSPQTNAKLERAKPSTGRSWTR